jgi:hypothetical protein
MADFFATPCLIIEAEEADEELAALIDCARAGRSLELVAASPICDFQAKAEPVRVWSCRPSDRPQTPPRFCSTHR